MNHEFIKSQVGLYCNRSSRRIGVVFSVRCACHVTREVRQPSNLNVEICTRNNIKIIFNVNTDRQCENLTAASTNREALFRHRIKISQAKEFEKIIKNSFHPKDVLLHCREQQMSCIASMLKSVYFRFGYISPTTCTHTNARVIHTKPITTHARTHTHTGQIIPFAQLYC